MSSERTKGWFASLAIHGLLGVSILYFAGARSPSPEPLHEAKTLVINLNGDNSSPAPGEGGGNSLIPFGDPNPAPPPPDPQPDPKPDPQPDPEPTPPPPTPPPPPPTPPPPKPPKPEKPKVEPAKPRDRDPKPPKPATERIVNLDLDKIRANHERQNNAGKTSTTRDPARQDVRKKNGSGVPQLDANAILGSSGPIGSQNGRGKGGTSNGGGPVLSNYRARLATVIQHHWQQQLDSASVRVPPGIVGEFRFTISRHGTINFAGWVLNPSNPAFESLVRRTLDSIGTAVGPPPAGFPSGVNGDDIIRLVAET